MLIYHIFSLISSLPFYQSEPKWKGGEQEDSDLKLKILSCLGDGAQTTVKPDVGPDTQSGAGRGGASGNNSTFLGSALDNGAACFCFLLQSHKPSFTSVWDLSAALRLLNNNAIRLNHVVRVTERCL